MIRTMKNDPPWLKAAFKDLGLKEIKGKKHNARVVEMFAESGSPWVIDDETAWCAAAIGAWLKSAGVKGTGSLAARSYMKWGKKVTRPKRGNIAVFIRGSSTWQGHVAFYLSENRTHVTVIGGNQTNMVSIATYRKAKLLGYRKPATVGNSKVIKAATITGAGAVAGLVDMASPYIPDVLGLIPSVDTSWLLGGLMISVLGLMGFIIWDRYIKVRDKGV